MTADDLTALLLGSTGALVLSLILNYLFWKGRILNPKATMPREDYDAVVAINASYVAKFGEMVTGMKRLGDTVARLASAMTRRGDRPPTIRKRAEDP